MRFVVLVMKDLSMLHRIESHLSYAYAVISVLVSHLVNIHDDWSLLRSINGD